MNQRGFALIGFLFVGFFMMQKNVEAKKTTDKAILAGGCFWCMEGPFEALEGVKSVVSGYTGGKEENPTYEQVSAGGTGHAEAIEIVFDPTKVSYEKILEVFWMQIDPTQADGQFVDKGKQYRSGIYYRDEEQKKIALESKKKLQESGRFGDKNIVTEIEKAEKFYPAEDYHQDYYKTHPGRYKSYRSHSGRDQFIEKVWKK